MTRRAITPATEPVLSASVVSSLVIAALGLAATFGLNLTAEQTGATVVLVALVVKTVSAFIVRRKVRPVVK